MAGGADRNRYLREKRRWQEIAIKRRSQRKCEWQRFLRPGEAGKSRHGHDPKTAAGGRADTFVLRVDARGRYKQAFSLPQRASAFETSEHGIRWPHALRDRL